MLLQTGWETRWRWLALVVGVAAFWFTLSRADWPHTFALFTSVGIVGFCAILVPQFMGMVADTLSWRGVLQLLTARPLFTRLLRVRIGTEAVAQSLPGGPLFAESVTPSLLRDAGVQPSVTVASQVARRHLLIWSQGAYAALVVCFGFQTLRNLRGPGALSLGVVTAIVAAVLLGIGSVLRLLFIRRRVAECLFDAAAKLLWPRATAWLGVRRTHFIETDAATRTFFEAPFFRRLGVGSPLLAGWLFETGETWLITRLLGLHWSFAAVAAMELLVVLVRHVVFVVPAGLGVQDAGYVVFFQLLGAPDPINTGAASSLLKRAKELCWIAVGYLLLAPELLTRRLTTPAPVPVSES